MKEESKGEITPTINKIQSIFLSFLENEISTSKEKETNAEEGNDLTEPNKDNKPNE